MAQQDATGLVIHVSSVNDRSTEVVMQERIRIGPCDDCDVRIRLADRPQASTGLPVIELARENGRYHIVNFDASLPITINGKRIKFDAEIEDGDEVWIGPSGPSLHFFPVSAARALVPGRREARHVAPFIEQASMEASATARRDDAKIFLREFTRELVREINPSTKILTFAILIALVLGVLYIGFALFNEIRTSRRIADDQRAKTGQVEDQLTKVSERLSALGRSNKEIMDSLSLAVKLRSDYGAGVCLLSGSFMFTEWGTGRPLRYPETQAAQSGAPTPSGNESPLLTPEGKGPVAEFEFVGTGFYVGDGFVLTNRHVAQPWLADERAQTLTSSVRGQPRLKRLVAFFPDHPQPVTLKFKLAARGEDLSVCTMDQKDVPAGIPALPLEKDSDSVAVGKMVVMMGYPNGPDRLLALLEEDEARGIQARYSSLESMLGYLAETKHIQPLTTQGNITDLNARRIVYDARTAEGGSGAPLFGPSGHVIGVNFAVFTENTASNYAVPIRYGISLLQRANWQPPQPLEPEPKEGAGKSEARGTAAANTPR